MVVIRGKIWISVTLVALLCATALIAVMTIGRKHRSHIGPLEAWTAGNVGTVCGATLKPGQRAFAISASFGNSGPRVVTIVSARVAAADGASVSGGPWRFVRPADGGFDILPLPIAHWPVGERQWAKRTPLERIKLSRGMSVDVAFGVTLESGVHKARVSHYIVDYQVAGSSRTYSARGAYTYILSDQACR